MQNFSRRSFLHATPAGLAALAFLPADARATEPSGELGDYAQVLEIPAAETPGPDQPWPATEDNILGPYHRPGAPFRAKITPPLEPGDALLVRGRVWGLDTRRPLAGAVLDIWQANAEGRYDNDDPQNPPAPGLFLNRARLTTDESGYYEFETIRPGQYQTGPQRWRPAHIHYMARAARYKTLVTQLYFRGDKYNERDQFVKPSLIVDFQTVEVRQGSFSLGQFDIVLIPA